MPRLGASWPWQPRHLSRGMPCGEGVSGAARTPLALHTTSGADRAPRPTGPAGAPGVDGAAAHQRRGGGAHLLVPDRRCGTLWGRGTALNGACGKRSVHQPRRLQFPHARRRHTTHPLQHRAADVHVQLLLDAAARLRVALSAAAAGAPPALAAAAGEVAAKLAASRCAVPMHQHRMIEEFKALVGGGLLWRQDLVLFGSFWKRVAVAQGPPRTARGCCPGACAARRAAAAKRRSAPLAEVETCVPNALAPAHAVQAV